MSQEYNPNGSGVVAEKRAVCLAFSAVLLLSSQFVLDVQRRRTKSMAGVYKGHKMSTSAAGHSLCSAYPWEDGKLVSLVDWIRARRAHRRHRPPAERHFRELDLSRHGGFRCAHVCGRKLCWIFVCSRIVSLWRFALDVADSCPSQMDPLTRHDG